MCFVCGLEYALKGRDFCRDECEQWVNNNGKMSIFILNVIIK
jgi:predicted nucleic acid-binding Zn ribbon protein